jgi:hypothetical protein
MASESITLADLPGWTRGLADRLAGLDLTRPLQTVGLYLAAQARRCFDEQRSPDGVPWAGWKHPPSARRGGPSAKLLRDRDVLMASLVGKGAYHVERVTRASLLWGTAVPYGKYHQDGTRTIPARPFVGVSGPMLDRIEQILLDYAARVFGGGPESP